GHVRYPGRTRHIAVSRARKVSQGRMAAHRRPDPGARTRPQVSGFQYRCDPGGTRKMTDALSTIPPVVSARGLKKSFGGKEILHGLDFDIPAGRIYGLIGHNGAGKTTTLNAMLGLTSYDGTIRVLGEDPFARRAHLMEN